MSANLATKIMSHPDKDEILNKLVSGVSAKDIAEWLESKYINVGERKFVLSEKVISSFEKTYLDFYNVVRDDIDKTKTNLTAEEELKLQINGSPNYHKALEQYVNNEVDIKTMVKRVVAAIEMRASQVFDQIQEDPRNIKMDRTLIEWFNVLTGLLEKYDVILNGNPENINIQNNISIQVVDDRINIVYNIIREILTKLDYDTSLLFIELFNDGMKKLNSETLPIVASQEERIEDVKILASDVDAKLKN